MKKLSKKKIIGLVCVALAGTMAVSAFANGKSKDIQVIQTQPIERRTIENKVSATGIVSSVNSTKVSADVDGKVQNVEVKVGDVVKEGDVLCTLDTEMLELDIAEAKNSLQREKVVGEKKLSLSEEKHDDAKKEFEKNSSSSLYGASSSVLTARDSYKDADDDYDDAKSDYRKAQAEESRIKSEYDALVASGTASEGDINSKKKELEAAAINVSAKKSSYDSADDRREKNRKDLDDAKREYDHTKETEEKELKYQEATLETDKLDFDVTSTQISLDRLQKKYEQSTIKSPISGTVTAVYAKEDSQATGVLFVVEDLSILKIDTKIKEYDIARVSVGMPAVIKSDALVGKEFTGELASFSPVALKEDNGEEKKSGNVALFGAEVKMTGETDGLLVGMNSRIEIKMESKENVLAVPVDSVVKNENGEDTIYIAEAEGEKTVAKAVVVKLGIQNDFYVEISADGIEEGTKIITNTDGIIDGMEINVLMQSK